MKIVSQREKDGKLRRYTEVKCLTCGKVFLKACRLLKKYPNHYCSNSCHFKGMRKYKLVACATCGKQIERTPARIRKSKSGLLFCSKICKAQAQSIGGLIPLTTYGNGQYIYRARAFRKYPHKCEICGYNAIEGILDVHHIDGKRSNNHIENLIILCPNHHVILSRKLGYLKERHLFMNSGVAVV